MKFLSVRTHFVPGLVALGAAEMLLTFVLALVLLTPAKSVFRITSVHPAVIFALTVTFVAFLIGLYRPEIFVRARTVIVNSLVSALITFPIIWIVSKALGLGDYWFVGYDQLRPIKIIVIWTAAILFIRLLFLAATRLGFFLCKAAVVSSDNPALTVTVARAEKRGFLHISTIRPERASASRLRAENIRTLIFPHGTDGMIVPAISEEYRRNGILVQNQADFWEARLRRIDLSHLDSNWFEGHKSSNYSWLSVTLTRWFDVAMSIILLVTTLPIMLVIALCIRLDSVGPTLYRQERTGLLNKPFMLFKFRSMRVNAEVGGPSWAQLRDPRVTRVGSFMRKTRVDELPQLFNILKGEMSFIGPRPERPHFVEQLQQLIPCYVDRARVKPGLTGWAQVNYPYGASVEDAKAKLSYDLYYVKNKSIFLDMLIVLSTVRVILFQEGAR